MPRKTGFEVLEWLKANDEFRTIPVAIFSSSTNTDDIRGAVSRAPTVIWKNRWTTKPNRFDGKNR